MHFILQTPPLQHLVEVQIVAALWNQRDISPQIPRSFYVRTQHTRLGYINEKWEAMEESVKSKISALPLPEPCKKRLLPLIKPLGMEVVGWYSVYEGSTISVHLFPRQLVWTMHGTIDYAKTAELMVKNESLNVESRYEVACVNCFEGEARQLFELIPESRKCEYIEGKRLDWGSDQRPLIVYFSCILSDNADQLNNYFQSLSLPSRSINKYLFNLILPTDNPVSFEYLFNKLNQREKEQVLMNPWDQFKLLRTSNFSTARSLLYYFWLRNDELGFQKHTRSVLRCLLRWPMQSLFMETARRGWNFLDNVDYQLVLNDITIKISRGYKDFDYSKLFWEFWSLSSGAYKRSYLELPENVSSLLATKREEFIKLILNEAPSGQIKDDFYEIRPVLMDESAISDAALMECKEKAATISSNDPGDKEKRLRSEYLSIVVGIAMKKRIKRRKRRL